MAGALYKGITIKLGADPTPISKAMKTVDSEARELQKNLNTVNKSLKFNENDPSLLAQKFTIINEQIDTTKERLKQLIEYEKIAREQFEKGDISKSQYTSLTREISKTRTELQSLEHDSKEAFDSLKTSILGAKEKVSDFTKSIKTAAATLGIAFSVNKIKDIGNAAIETASDLREVQNVVDTSFGDLAYMMEDLADKAIETYGISRLTAKETGSTFMAMARGMDIVPKTAAEMSIALTELSADMASFYNVEQQVASTALNSVFTGETETLKKFGIVMTEANLNAYAMSQGIEKTVKQMSQAEKVQLRYNYVMQQTSLVHGDFAKTSGEWANRSRVLKEEITELSAMVGEELINNLGNVQGKADSLFKLVKDAKQSGQLAAVIGDVTDALNELIDLFVRAVEFIYKYRSEIALTIETLIALKAALKLYSTVANVIDVISGLKNAFMALTASTKAQEAAQASLNATMSINPYAALFTAVTALAAVIETKLYKNTIKVNEAFLQMGEAEKAIREITDAAEDFNESVSEAAKNREENISSVENEYRSYKSLADQLYSLAGKQEKTAEDYKKINSLVETLNGSIQGLGLSFDSITGRLNLQHSELTGLIDDYEAYYKTMALQESLTQMYKDQYEVEQNLIDLKDEQQKALERLTAAEENLRVKQTLLAEEGVEKNKKLFEERNKEALDAYEEFQDAQLAYNDIWQAVNETSEAYSKLGRDIADATDYISENADKTEKISEREKNAAEKLTESVKSVEDLTSSYTSAKEAVKDYSSELSSLISLQKELSEGNEMSGFEMLALIEKYPELTSKIRETENGYILEKEAIEELIKVKARNMELSAQEAAESKRALLEQQGMSKFEIFSAEKLFDAGAVKDIASLQAGEYTESLKEYLAAYSQKKGIGKIVSDMFDNGIKEGSKSSIASSDAEAAFKELEHQHNMGLKSDEQYYNELERLNNKYYKDSKDNLDKFWSYEEKIYAYRQKAAEALAKSEEKSNADNAKSLESLKNKIYDVIDARNELNGIKSNKNVYAYQGAAGFQYEADQSKLKKAYDSLLKAQDNLLIEKLGLGNTDSEAVKKLKQMLSALEGSGVNNFLPDLKKAYSELKQTTNNTTNKIVNVNFGDIYTDGSDNDIEAQLEKFVDAIIKLADKE